ncbi:phosphate/phosphite/phosphonate ABC transporter substrate-binding protein [Alkalicella caledoniensis]|uniref:Phosphate/phosphite/phosphonate ABC transporter substrate-binding protein n=1 Tax=Alkalicella caledoniensis TaxID=2731377 RepID=A0A7G9W6U0_ALKCA|nr:phosphate/phosphite/phosphonate ABC transporter substrate-binding protein [Alkalicella caledoniensis]QNO14402.1 phosphate/phosphite/phosphonate ABC transporter substrate-binding protein [Alkalicella caledoniensis]
MKFYKRISTILIAFLILALVSGCTNNTSNEDVLVMGFVPMRDGDALIESVKPLEELLSQELGIKVKAFTATNYVGVVEGLGSGQVDFGFIPPFAYVLANSENKAQVILTALNSSGKSNYRSQFLVSSDDNSISSLEDLQGKKVAFVDFSSTSGYLFPGAHLAGLGLELDNDIEVIIAGGHDKALQLLLNGDVDAATTFVDARDRYASDFPGAMEKTRVLGYTDYIPNITVTTRGTMESELQGRIQAALLNIAESEEGAEMLKELFNMYGFVKASDSDYDIIRETARLMNVNLKEQD